LLEILRPKQAAIFGDALDCLTLWLHYYVTGELERFMAEYREMALASLQG